MPSSVATIPLGELLRQYHLELTQITGLDDRSLLDSPVQWVHSTDLLDPQPFVSPRTVLLTTGSQFHNVQGQNSAQRTYVARLQEAGVCALGFSVGFDFERIPEPLLEACEEQHLPLFRVPYSTPFIEIVQTAARLLDREAHSRDAWSVAAQWAVANRALQGNGIAPVVRELSKQLGSWVGIFDNTGTLIQSSANTFEEYEPGDVSRAVLDVMTSQVRASRTVTFGEQRLTVQTLGRRGELFGALVVHDTGNLDRAAQSVINIAVALTSSALEQMTALSGPLDQLRSARIELLVAGQTQLAHRVGHDSLTPLPPEPVVVASLTARDERSLVATRMLTALRDDQAHTGSVASQFDIASADDEIILLIAQPFVARIEAVLREAGTPAGLSAPHPYHGIARAVEQARSARDIVESGAHAASGTILHYTPGLHRGVLRLLRDHPEAHTQARALLEPLLNNDERNSEQLTESLRVWLGSHGQYQPAAAALSIHRHTLKTRIARAAQLLDKDLDSADVRANLWSALTLLEEGVTPAEKDPTPQV